MSRASTAEKKATDLLEEFGIREAPIPVEDLARHLGAQLTYEAFDGDVSGMLYRADDRAIIGVNSHHATTRQRFTVAHEIAHLRLHKGQPVFVDSFARVNLRNGKSTREEVEANAFAAELLMPEALVQHEVDRVLTRDRDITPLQLVGKLANKFQVSTEAMTYRLSNVGVLDPYL